MTRANLALLGAPLGALRGSALGRWALLPLLLTILTLLPVLGYPGVGGLPFSLFAALTVFRGSCRMGLGGAQARSEDPT